MAHHIGFVRSATQARTNVIDLPAFLKKNTRAPGVRIHQCGTDDGAERLVRELTNGGNDLGRHLFIASVHEEYRIVAHLSRDVATCSRNQIDLTLNLQNIEFQLGPIRILRKRHLLRGPDLLLSGKHQKAGRYQRAGEKDQTTPIEQSLHHHLLILSPSASTCRRCSASAAASGRRRRSASTTSLALPCRWRRGSTLGDSARRCEHRFWQRLHPGPVF